MHCSVANVQLKLWYCMQNANKTTPGTENTKMNIAQIDNSVYFVFTVLYEIILK